MQNLPRCIGMIFDHFLCFLVFEHTNVSVRVTVWFQGMASGGLSLSDLAGLSDLLAIKRFIDQKSDGGFRC